MDIVKTAALRDQSDEQLNAQLQEIKENLFRLRLQSATERLEVPSQITRSKRQIARIMTILRERELASTASKP